jgi:diaminohydroxyphosphoribosylaminopyrimidine deaminase/5-amino-6-(5-phosphoribosylamino)uracil reductase
VRTEDDALFDARWMADACREAERGLGHTAPNPAVGCVIVKRGRVVGRGHHRRAGGPHAEVEALHDAGGRARGATVYLTLEPCCHQGRTAPCVDALLDARVSRVVVGCIDPNPRVTGRGLAKLSRHGVHTAKGVLGDRCHELIRGFECWIKHRRPWVHLKLAASLDGRIAARSGASKWISSAPSRARVQAMRARSDAVLVGIGTVLRLTCRAKGARNPLRVVLDHRLRTPTEARVVKGSGRALVVCSPGAAAVRRRRLEAAGVEVLALDTAGKRGWHRLLRELAARDVMELLLEGGGEVAGAALAARVVNAMTIFYNPRLIGADGIAMVGPLGVRHPSEALRMHTTACEIIGDDVVWTGVSDA